MDLGGILIFLIEDICLNFGGKLNNKFYGSFGDAAIVSFGYDKIISEKGGAVIIKEKKFYLKVKKNLIPNPILYKTDLNKRSFIKKINVLNKNILNRSSNAKFLYDSIKSKSFKFILYSLLSISFMKVKLLFVFIF